MEQHSPNFNSRGGEKISLLVLHYTGMKSAQEAIERLCKAEAKVSAHYVVDEDGTVTALVDEADCAWHAGVSFWRGKRNVNPISIGVEIVNPGHEWGYRAFPQKQMEAVAKLCKGIVLRHHIAARDVVAHSDIAPQRKEDPGELFDWQWLAGQGVGLWPEVRVQSPESGSQKKDVSKMQTQLTEYGYETPQNGIFDEATRKVAIAFQRHFRPNNIQGQWDNECAGLLAALLASAGH